MKKLDWVLVAAIFLVSWVLLSILSSSKRTFPTVIKETYKERYDVYSRCYDVTNDYEKALACIEIHKYLQGE